MGKNIDQQTANEKGDEDFSVLEQLFYMYISEKPIQTDLIRQQFQALERIMKDLTLEENDAVSNLVCTLCAEHAKCAYFEGVRVGFHLSAELMNE